MYANLEEILTRAAKPTVDAITGMQKGAPRSIRDMLAEIGEKFCWPGYTVAAALKAVRGSNKLITLFRLRIGLTPWSFIRECRMETALRLLRDTSLPTAEVASLVGYDALRPFEKLCLRWCGLSPGRFRKHLRRVQEPLSRLPEDVFTWHFWERCRGGELSVEEARLVIGYLKELYGLGPAPVQPAAE